MESRKSVTGLNELAMANVEDLVTGESGGGYDCCNTCKGSYCGKFVPSDGGASVDVYWR